MQRVLSRYQNIILSYRILRFDQFGASLRLRAEIEFVDRSKLYVRETVISGKKRTYSYHWQDHAGQLISRWDNAPDWNVETFPHHKHVGSEDIIEPSYERTLDQVLNVVSHKLPSQSPE
jgi:hypothetical protein